MNYESTAVALSEAISDDVESFIRSIADELLGYFARRVVPHEDAADCLSETLLVLWQRSDRLPAERGDRRAWSYGIAHRVLAAQRRNGLRQLSLATRLREELQFRPLASESGDDEAITALASLSARDRELVTLVVWEELTIAQAATALGIKAEAARARYSRARRSLRLRLSAPV